MPSYPVRALALKKTKLSESDLIVTFLALDGSQIRAVAKGARKPKSKLCGMLEQGTVLDLLLSQGRNLDIITEARIVQTNEGCRGDLDRSSACSSICELCMKLSLEGEGQQNFFPMALAALASISTADCGLIPLIVSSFIIKACSLLGYRPELSTCVFCASDARQSHRFSYEGGGVVCDSCSSDCLEAVQSQKALIGWLRFMMASTFCQISACKVDSSIGMCMLDVCERWLSVHIGISLKSTQLLRSLY